ncbi:MULTISPECIES: L-aspartate oxidase [Sulfurimonas]|uniref:L-aspartate oxidase n=1 Tax=Sulfurimonas diazotrophicus TaxID=3131939 RepID=A0ABZ3H8X9_9BACT
MQYDVLIIGAGVAGLYAALNIPTDKKVLLINKTRPWECNTYYAQGGVTTARNDADIPIHIKDTLDAGAGMCNEEAVRVLSETSQSVVRDLMARGFKFDTGENGRLLYTKEAAHSADRILHAGGDATGRHLHHFLLLNNPHPMLANATVIDFLIEAGQICGVEVVYKGERKVILAHQVILASGGVGSLYRFHTNAYSISGDIQGICVEKGIALDNMEMMQFHPTVYLGNQSVQKQLLSEALRGEGAQVEDEDGYRFLFDYDPRGELAPRDIVSRALFDYRRKTKKQIYLSFREFDPAYFHKRFPNISANLRDMGFDVPKDRVPVSPAFHYAIGGIKTDLEGHVAGVKGLYAIGEAASTGVHGANRLASNSLLEGLVFAKRATAALLSEPGSNCSTPFAPGDEPLFVEGDKEKKEQLRRIMWKFVSIVRTTEGLQEALATLDAMLASPIGRMLRLRLLTAHEIVRAALAREESVGVHYREN